MPVNFLSSAFVVNVGDISKYSRINISNPSHPSFSNLIYNRSNQFSSNWLQHYSTTNSIGYQN